LGVTGCSARATGPVTPVVSAVPVAFTPAPATLPAAAPAPVQTRVAGRHALGAHKTVQGTHQRNFYREDTRAALVVELAEDGGVTACRGLHSRSSHHTDHGTDARDLRDQQGYRGRWSQRDGELDLRFAPDAAVCPTTRAYTNLEPRPWHLRCTMVTPQEHPQLASAALACRLINRGELMFSEEYGLELPGILPDPMILLGRGDGVEVEWSADSLVPPDSAPEVEVRPAVKRIEAGSWELPAATP
ncbi:MAG TPA: hypothetical protein VGB85_27485, partial [Nannocystis sp.]